MPRGVLLFLKHLSENKEDAHGNLGVDPASHQKEHQSNLAREEKEKKNKLIEEEHIGRVRRSLLKLGKKEATDCTKILGDNEFRFCQSQSHKKDLEISHKHSTNKNSHYKNLKIELKGKGEKSRTDASHYALPLDNKLNINLYDHTGKPIQNDKGVHQKITFIPRDYLKLNPLPTNVKDCISKCNQNKNKKNKQQCIDMCNTTKVSKGRTDTFNPKTRQPGWFEFARRTISNGGGTEEVEKLQNEEIKRQSIKHTVAKALPYLMGTFGTHATISGNSENIHVIQHYNEKHPDRVTLNDLLLSMGLTTTHESHEITGTSGSPHITYPTSVRGSHAILRISHKTSDPIKRKITSSNAMSLI